MSLGYSGVKRLAEEHNDWLPIVKVCFDYSKRFEIFAGRWVLKELKRNAWEGLQYKNKPVPWFPGLRLLVGYEILKHEDTTRGGRRAYYSMPDRIGVEKALNELNILV